MILPTMKQTQMIPLDCLQLYENAQFYDEEFKNRVHDIPFYRTRAVTSGGPVLEIACGSGRLTIPIAQAGIDIVGVDVSAHMIEQARHWSIEAGLNIEWHVQDVRVLKLDRRFRLIFMAANAFQHLHDIESVLSFFERIHRHLEDDGLLILDVFNPAPEKLVRKLGFPYPHKSFILKDGRQIDVEADSEYIQNTQTLHFILTYLCKGKVVLVKDVRMRCFFPQELVALCRMGGLDVVERLGNYEGHNFIASSPKQILVCRKIPSLRSL